MGEVFPTGAQDAQEQEGSLDEKDKKDEKDEKDEREEFGKLSPSPPSSLFDPLFLFLFFSCFSFPFPFSFPFSFSFSFSFSSPSPFPKRSFFFTNPFKKAVKFLPSNSPLPRNTFSTWSLNFFLSSPGEKVGKELAGGGTA